MSRKFLTPIDLAQNELQNARVQNLAGAPSTPVKGQLYMNTSDNTLYWWDGTTWQPAKSGAPAFGNVVATSAFGQASADGALTTVSRSDHVHGSPAHAGPAHAAVSLSSLAAPTADLAMGGFKLTSVAAPAAPTDAANKGYVDGVAQGLDTKASVKVATTANITLSTEQTIDGVAAQTGDRVLVKNQTTTNQNGIYIVAAGAWTRSTDMDVDTEVPGAYTFVESGTTQADTGWVCTTNFPVALGSTPIVWAQFSGAGAYTAGAGLTQTGTTFDVVAANGSLTVGANDIQVAYAGTGSAVTAAKSDHTHTAGPGRFTAAVTAATSTVINHNLATRDVIVDVYRVASPYDSVEADVERTDTNNVTVRFAVAPSAGEYRVVVVG